MEHVRDWHIFADRFIWSDEEALRLIPDDVFDEEIQQYLYTFHRDIMSPDEIQAWRRKEQFTRDGN